MEFLLADDSGTTLDPDVDDPALIVTPEATSRSGPQPVLLECPPDDEPRIIAQEIVRRHQHGAAWRDMVVLCGNRKWSKRTFFALRDVDVPMFDVQHRPRTRSR